MVAFNVSMKIVKVYSAKIAAGAQQFILVFCADA